GDDGRRRRPGVGPDRDAPRPYRRARSRRDDPRAPNPSGPAPHVFLGGGPRPRHARHGARRSRAPPRGRLAGERAPGGPLPRPRAARLPRYPVVAHRGHAGDERRGRRPLRAGAGRSRRGAPPRRRGRRGGDGPVPAPDPGGRRVSDGRSLLPTPVLIVVGGAIGAAIGSSGGRNATGFAAGLVIGAA